jgi:hypothetical protein
VAPASTSRMAPPEPVNGSASGLPVGLTAYRVRVSTTSWLYRPPHQADTATCPGPDDTLQVRRKLPSHRAVAGVSCPTLAVLG